MAKHTFGGDPRTSSLARRLTPWLLISALVIAADQISKFAIERQLGYGQRVPVLPTLDLTRVYNTGAAFSFLSNQTGWQRWFFTGIGILAALVIVRLLARHGKEPIFSLALALVLGGALGNVIDRVLHGRVVDFILAYWRDWYFPAFNVADSAITIGAVLLVCDELFRVARTR